ncbi:MAG: triose-phosphate isomerase [Candidatus Yanofskybacteria bacterium RIFCSPHIGHO2_02_FULL_43_15c]|uniref:Triosephosphate isomerase n=1 Tax=Candidatus Yanofskybacteria bacterium RIFCSPHIGHO2_02_FULL_43_15c TaxID=1802679 RepID=A0A1F8FFW4_9BACT|nr:MAG: triose-phosphate isomerase [Candidatus Yanofskybacteria bacterium RIFCSPHIGHO2_02_FULL_43_15c]OGY65458.1 MAG: triose-phosphate isomerase [Candidatus Harrisonbacteria bacterium RIFCSPLOWO2_02_FULL_41_11]
MSDKLLIFNWKMNPATLKKALFLAKVSDYENVVVCPPFPFIEEVGEALKKAKLGAQDVFYESKGAYTGEVSAQELKNLCVEYVIVGHSERRHKLGETDEMIAKKLKAALENGLIPILCVGETKKERGAGKREAVIERQLKTGLSLYPKPYTLNPIIAYEPVWAIGTGNPETPESALESIKFIKSLVQSQKLNVKCQMLYGGSVDSKNLGGYLQYKEIDGALVGGASLKKEEIKKMVKLATAK